MSSAQFAKIAFSREHFFRIRTRNRPFAWYSTRSFNTAKLPSRPEEKYHKKQKSYYLLLGIILVCFEIRAPSTRIESACKFNGGRAGGIKSDDNCTREGAVYQILMRFRSVSFCQMRFT
jgi:hypothetical protein